MTTETSREFEDLLLFVKENRGFHFTEYKRPSLLRRLERRMQTVGVRDHADYRWRLEHDPEEFAELIDTILINLTAFFRDPLPSEYLAKEIVPRVIDGKAEET